MFTDVKNVLLVSKLYNLLPHETVQDADTLTLEFP